MMLQQTERWRRARRWVRRLLPWGVAVTASCAPRATTTPAVAPADDGSDSVVTIVPGDHVSRSRGEPGGLVLLWPRIIPSADAASHTALAAAIQSRLGALAGEALPGRVVDVRPEGERVCIKTGCLASSIGVLLLVRDGQCVAVVSVTAPGKSDHALVPWAGDVTHDARVPFRQPLESHVKVRDMIPCDALATHAATRDGDVRDALATLP